MTLKIVSAISVETPAVDSAVRSSMPVQAASGGARCGAIARWP